MAFQTVSPNVVRLSAARTMRESAQWAILCIGERIEALIIFILTLPIAVAAGGIIVLQSRRSPLVSHLRLGRSGRELRVLKLRTMWGEDAAPWRWQCTECVGASLSPATKEPSDRRVGSRFARLIRRFSIDELPQLWQVVRGEMALIGPRPLTFEEMEKYYGHDAGEVLSMKPGITGLWQVRGRSRLNYRQRRRLDLFMVRRWSVRLYVFIAVSTLPKVLLGRDAW